MTSPALSPTSPKTDRLDAVLPESSRLYVGPGVTIKGDIHFDAKEPDQRLVICGEVEGNISTNGLLQIAEGAVIRGTTTIDCAEIVVAGSVVGNNVTIKAKLLYLLATGNIAVEKLCLPPGGLEQSRGGVLNARLDMSAEYGDAPEIVADSSVNGRDMGTVRPIFPATSIKPVLAAPAQIFGSSDFEPGFNGLSKAPDIDLPSEGVDRG